MLYADGMKGRMVPEGLWVYGPGLRLCSDIDRTECAGG